VCRSFWAVSEKGKAILAKEQELPNEQAHYHTAWVMLDPEVRGNGLMTVRTMTPSELSVFETRADVTPIRPSAGSSLTNGSSLLSIPTRASSALPGSPPTWLPPSYMPV
jgi:hypothetical protein